MDAPFRERAMGDDGEVASECDVERDGMDVKRDALRRERARGRANARDWGDEGELTMMEAARANARTNKGVREDDEVTETFGVLIPNTQTSGNERESATKAARRFAVEAQKVASRTRLETLVAPPAEEKDAEGREREVVVANDAEVKFEVRSYNDVTSKYINLDYYEKRVAPRTKFLDGRTNDEVIRTTTWVFGEEFAKRDGFVSEGSETESEDEMAKAETAPETDENEVGEEVKAEMTSSWCCGERSATPVRVVKAKAEAVEREPTLLERQAVVTEELAVLRTRLAKLELNIEQSWADTKRFAQQLENEFTKEMIDVDPRAEETKKLLRNSEAHVRQMLKERNKLSKKETKLKHIIYACERENMMPPNAVVASKEGNPRQEQERQTNSAKDKTKQRKITQVRDPLVKIGRSRPEGLMAMFYFLAPMYLWKYYEWISVERPVKQSLKAQTTSKSMVFYNPLLVPGARRLRLPASVAEQLAMLLAVQAMLSFQLFVIDQSPDSRGPHIALYMCVLLSTFNKVATPACAATMRSSKRRQVIGENKAAGALWSDAAEVPAKQESSSTPVRVEVSTEGILSEAATVADVSMKTNNIAVTTNDVPAKVSDASYASVKANEVNRSIVAEQSRLADSVQNQTSGSSQGGVDNPEQAQRTFTSEFEELEDKVAHLEGAEKKAALRALILIELEERERKAAHSHDPALSIRGSQLEGNPLDDDSRSLATSTRAASTKRASASEQGNDDTLLTDVNGDAERLRREYVAKVREERRKENAAANAANPIFDVSEYLETIFNRGDSKSGAQNTSAAEQLKSTLVMEDIDTVFQAVHGTSARHKKKFGGGRGHWPEHVSLKELDKSKIAAKLEEDETWDATVVLDNSREPIA